jgi:hypothetical protein
MAEPRGEGGRDEEEEHGAGAVAAWRKKGEEEHGMSFWWSIEWLPKSVGGV